MAGEPAAPYSTEQNNPPNIRPWPRFFERTLNVERYIHRTSLGSDVYVEVVYKGFLFPYGFRAALIKVTEREPKVFGNLGPVMPAIQRVFIQPRTTPKRFPGIYQPFGGRDIPVREARMEAGFSPEIEEDFAAPQALRQACPGLRGRVFWPRAKGQTSEGEVLFSFEADGTNVRRSAPMIFVDNEAAHHPETIRCLVSYYNDPSLEIRLRTELHHGGRTIFSEPGQASSTPEGIDRNADGNTGFDTDHILLGARGRIVLDASTQAETELFEMDAFMEGADEPPFYPVMREAAVAIPALDRLLGSAQGLKRIGFDANYVRNGFDRRANPSELYLRFLEGGGVMQIAGKGEVSGGVVQTPTPLAGISRANAIVGGKPRPSLPAVAPAAAGAILAAGADELSPWDLTDVVDGRFNPAKYFKLGKLLGIIDLGEIVKAALIDRQPQLRETLEYAASAGEGGVAGAKRAAAAAADAVGRALVSGEETLAEAMHGLLGGGPLPPPDQLTYLRLFYPDLIAGILALQAALRDCGKCE